MKPAINIPKCQLLVQTYLHSVFRTFMVTIFLLNHEESIYNR